MLTKFVNVLINVKSSVLGKIGQQFEVAFSAAVMGARLAIAGKSSKNKSALTIANLRYTHTAGRLLTL